MNEFDSKAGLWDLNPVHLERSEAVAKQIIERIPLHSQMKALEFGAGTGLTSFMLKDHLKEIIMMDNSPEMVKIMNEKIASAGASNLKAVFHDLEKDNYNEEKFDLIITQMVIHHINNTENIISKFSHILNRGGFLVIADLYPEDGSFHGTGFSGHKGFDTEDLSLTIRNNGFDNISHRKCFVINKQISENEIKPFDVFLMIAGKL